MQPLRRFAPTALAEWRWNHRSDVAGTSGRIAWNAHSVTIAVQDEGIGIAPERMHCLFQQFCRIDSPHTRTVPGTGLGLYLTRKIVQEVLGGEVGVESSPGAGSTFWITIPRELPE